MEDMVEVMVKVDTTKVGIRIKVDGVLIMETPAMVTAMAVVQCVAETIIAIEVVDHMVVRVISSLFINQIV